VLKRQVVSVLIAPAKAGGKRDEARLKPADEQEALGERRWAINH
jgi:hypothetical protein